MYSIRHFKSEMSSWVPHLYSLIPHILIAAQANLSGSAVGLWGKQVNAASCPEITIRVTVSYHLERYYRHRREVGYFITISHFVSNFLRSHGSTARSLQRMTTFSQIRNRNQRAMVLEEVFPFSLHISQQRLLQAKTRARYVWVMCGMSERSFSRSGMMRTMSIQPTVKATRYHVAAMMTRPELPKQVV